jgi:excisionase family DNA binding protein
LTKPIILDQGHALLTEEAAANQCGVTRPTFRRWVAARCIQPVLVPGGGSRRLYRREDVESFGHSL